MYERFRALFRPVLERVSGFGMQDDENAGRVLRLGVDPLKVTVTGSLKSAAAEAGLAPEPPQPAGKRGPVVVAGSTHGGEEEILLDVLPEWRRLYPDLLMILAPRHPQRFGEVERLLRQRELRYRKRSQAGDEGQPGDYAVLLLDTLGELPRYYGCADVAFVGGTLVPAGGHNLLEPARWGKPVLFGPHCSNVAGTARELLRQGGGVEVRGRDDLLREVAGLLCDRARASAMGLHAAPWPRPARKCCRAAWRWCAGSSATSREPPGGGMATGAGIGTALVLRAWNRRGVAGWILWGLLLPWSAVYRVVLGIRNGLYGSGLRTPRRLGVPVVSVGNITVGGTGKTPAALWLAQGLRRRGLDAAILTRGYGGRRPAARPATIDPETARAWLDGPDGDLLDYGDEPVMLSALYGQTVVVGADRFRAGMESAGNPAARTCSCWTTVSSTASWRGTSTWSCWAPMAAVRCCPPAPSASRSGRCAGPTSWW